LVRSSLVPRFRKSHSLCVDVVLMPVPLEISYKDEHGWDQTPEWKKFLDKVADMAAEKYPAGIADSTELAFDTVRDQILSEYMAWTNWQEWNDPLWFPDEDYRAAFVLTWLF